MDEAVARRNIKSKNKYSNPRDLNTLGNVNGFFYSEVVTDFVLPFNLPPFSCYR